MQMQVYCIEVTALTPPLPREILIETFTFQDENSIKAFSRFFKKNIHLGRLHCAFHLNQKVSTDIFIEGGY